MDFNKIKFYNLIMATGLNSQCLLSLIKRAALSVCVTFYLRAQNGWIELGFYVCFNF